MTREIKFRAWVKQEDNYALGIKKDQMMYDIVPMPAPNSEFFRKATYNHKEIIKQYTNFLSGQEYNGEVMQYTGLKDKNRKEIYERDVVKCEGFHQDTYVVKYGRASFVLGVQQGIYGLAIVMQDEYQMEIIGNIYENPELLK